MRSKFAEQPLPDAAFSPADEAIIHGGRRSILGRAIAPAAAALENMQDAADHSPIINPRSAADVLWQMRFDLAPLLIAEPKQVTSHLLPRIIWSKESATDSRINSFNGFPP